MSATRPAIGHVFFDLDDTLFNHTKAKIAAARRFLHGHLSDLDDENVNDAVERWTALADEAWALHERGALDFQGSRRRRIRAMFGKDMDDSTADELFSDFEAEYRREWVPFSAAVTFLSRTARHGRHVITNAPALYQQEKLEGLGLSNYFQTLTTPDSSGAWKPEPAIFRAALDAAGADPAQSLMIGDDYERDILPARALGMQTFQIRGEGSWEQILSTWPELPDSTQ